MCKTCGSPPCLVEGCETRSRTYGLCERHYAGIKNRKRRALLEGADHEPYSLAEIAERDAFACRLCSEMVDMTLRFPHSGSPSIDHRVPLSRGGADTPDNVQLAHLGCNCSKGAGDYGDGSPEAQDLPRTP